MAYSESSSVSLSDFEHFESSDEEYDAKPYQFEPIVTENFAGLDVNDQQSCDDAFQRAGNTNWCTCGHCIPMSSGRESVCCQEVEPVVEKCHSFTESVVTCITDHPGFDTVCLDRFVLETAYYQYRQQYGQMNNGENECQRYVAYRQLVRWCWGYLGKDIRVVLPSCAVGKIREVYPSQEYRGFEDC